MSYENLILYGAAIPRIDTDKNENGDSEVVVDATDPANKERVMDFFKNIK